MGLILTTNRNDISNRHGLLQLTVTPSSSITKRRRCRIVRHRPNRSYKKSDGTKAEQTEFHEIIVFGRTAQSCAQYYAEEVAPTSKAASKRDRGKKTARAVQNGN